MNEISHDAIGKTPRRTFIRRVAGGLSLGLAAMVTGPVQAQPVAQSGQPDWPGMLKGRHRQLVDAYAINDGAPLGFAYTFLATNDADWRIRQGCNVGACPAPCRIPARAQR